MSQTKLTLAEMALSMIRNYLDGVMAFNTYYRINFWNTAMERIFGKLARDVMNQSMLDVFPFLRETGLDRELERLLKGGSPHCRHPIEAPFGSGFYEAHHLPLTDGDGIIVGGYTVIRDVTQSTKAEQQWFESETRFRTMADTSPVLLWMSGKDALCTFFNQRWLDFTGRTLEEEFGNGWAEGVHPEDFQHAMNHYMSSFVQRREFRMEYRLRRADGQYRWVLDNGIPRYEIDGSFAGFIGSCIDITELREAHQKLQELNEVLEVKVRERTSDLMRSNKDLEQFAYAASHDLQEPLRMIYSYLQLLEENYKGSLDPQGLRCVDIAVDGAKRMQALIRDLLTYARLDSDGTPHEATDFKKTVDIVLNDLSVVIQETEAQVTSAFLPIVVANPIQMRVLFQNLISNAIKFRRQEENPRIRIFAETHGKDWLFGVEDNGIGIDAIDQERIFRIFQRLHERSRYPGTGIGLSICQKIVERHDGRIWAESRPGQGSTFFFTLPVRAAK
ncbi:PAS domain S-box protein [bacterium]|nr:PAS domain S-box protein [bacterium]